MLCVYIIYNRSHKFVILSVLILNSLKMETFYETGNDKNSKILKKWKIYIKITDNFSYSQWHLGVKRMWQLRWRPYGSEGKFYNEGNNKCTMA